MRVTKQLIDENNRQEVNSIKITTGVSVGRRIWNIIRAPFTYIFQGRVEL